MLFAAFVILTLLCFVEFVVKPINFDGMSKTPAFILDF